LLAGLGIAVFIVGFALQDTLGNFAAGLYRRLCLIPGNL
jgi:small conductance mechanosensitive channel